MEGGKEERVDSKGGERERVSTTEEGEREKVEGGRKESRYRGDGGRRNWKEGGRVSEREREEREVERERELGEREREGEGLLFVGCLTSQQHTSVSQGRICSDNSTCCHTETEVADPTFYITQSQYTDTGPTSPSTDPITPGAWQGSHWSANF